MSNPMVSIVSAGFEEGAAFEGRIVTELERFEESGMLRVLDLLFVRRMPGSGELETRPGIPGRPTLVSQADVDEVASALAPGQAAGLVLIEHVWAADLEAAVSATGGAILQHVLLEPEQTQALVR
jgi:hypothetical protein